ncbi:POTE ankyrin domain family member H isoform X2 [Eurytemora carolleeae]|uniref:POTE ankyrin domain family member H isoform X2 n=1 Tax=Eurytemora carolleeae TaxID=1294199 RepID=UPI000C787437|nr:POTE ankyrin domain family member H isoform X2 [Eurytemora carolleeae]|eukprot:XP_023338839.1 POTE ankyrin domain family member H-like isoform X2 [Eurytemora affinis]
METGREGLEEEFLTACKHGDTETFNRLLRSEININCRDGEPLRESIRNNYVEIWTSLLENPEINPNLTDENGRTALHVANWFNKEAAAARLVSMPGVNLNLKDNYGNTPIMMGVKYGTSDVLVVMLNCRGVEIMETDAQGRGLEEYARDSWRMSEQEKTEIVEIITLERRTRIRETCRIQDAPTPSVCKKEVGVLRERVNQMLDDLNRSFERDDEDLKGGWESETQRLQIKHEKEKRALKGRQERIFCDLESKHRKEKNELMTKQTKQTYEMKMRQGRETEEMIERQREEKSMKEIEKNKRISKCINMLQPASSPTSKLDKTEEAAGLLQKLAKETECPICLLEMKERVFQCVSGHTICESCHGRTEISSCPTCRSEFIGRAIAVEKMIRTIRGQN